MPPSILPPSSLSLSLFLSMILSSSLYYFLTPHEASPFGTCPHYVIVYSSGCTSTPSFLLTSIRSVSWRCREHRALLRRTSNDLFVLFSMHVSVFVNRGEGTCVYHIFFNSSHRINLNSQTTGRQSKIRDWWPRSIGVWFNYRICESCNSFLL